MVDNIAREYVGQISVAGRALVFGAALDPRSGRVVYLDMLGAVSSVEAVWARLHTPGKVAYLHRPAPHPVVQLDSDGFLTRYQRKLPGLDQDNLVLVADDHEETGPGCFTYLMDASTAKERAARVVNCLQQFCKVAVFDAWADHLLALGRTRNLVMGCICYGGVKLLTVTRDGDAWQQVICTALANGDLALPKEV